MEVLAGPEDPSTSLPEGREINMLGRGDVPGIPEGNGWYYLPVTDAAWYPSSRFYPNYLDILTWITSGAVFTLY